MGPQSCLSPSFYIHYTLFLLSNRSIWKIWILFPFFPKPKSNVSCHCLFAVADIIVFRVCFTGKAIKAFFSFHFLLKEMELDSIRCIAFDSFNYLFSFLGIIWLCLWRVYLIARRDITRPESSFGLGIQNGFLGFEIFAFVLEVGFDFPFSFLFLIFSSYVFLHWMWLWCFLF